MSDERLHYQLQAQVDGNCVTETHFVSDPSKNLRRGAKKKVWLYEKVIGRGAFGEVRLEKCEEDGRCRAVKKIGVGAEGAKAKSYQSELDVLIEFSKPKVSQLDGRLIPVCKLMNVFAV